MIDRTAAARSENQIERGIPRKSSGKYKVRRGRHVQNKRVFFKRRGKCAASEISQNLFVRRLERLTAGAVQGDQTAARRVAKTAD